MVEDSIKNFTFFAETPWPDFITVQANSNNEVWKIFTVNNKDQYRDLVDFFFIWNKIHIFVTFIFLLKKYL